MPSAGFSLEIHSTGYEKIHRAISLMSSEPWYRGIVRDTAYEVLEDWTSYAKGITHRLTGMLAESFKWDYNSRNYIGHVFINPRSVGLRGKSTIIWPKIYGPYEHARGGSHAFFERTLSARGYKAADAAFKALVTGVPKA